MLKIYSTESKTLSNEEFNKLYNITISAYAQTEKEVWGDNYVRISEEVYQSHVDDGEVLVAYWGDEIVGGVRFFKLRENIWTFSLLGADFNHSGKGIGRALIEKVEQIVRKNEGNRIHIEVLRAKGVDVGSKIILSNWYQRLGYDLVKTLDVFEVYNDEAKWAKLVNPSVFDCYLKRL